MSVGVDLWGPADEPTLMDETPPQWQAPVQSLTAFWNRTLLSWHYQSNDECDVYRQITHDMTTYVTFVLTHYHSNEAH